MRIRSTDNSQLTKMVSNQNSTNAQFPVREDGRKRYVPQEQLCKLKTNLPHDIPRGHRTPNSLIWARHLTEFYWINNRPNDSRDDAGSDGADLATNDSDVEGDCGDNSVEETEDPQIWSISMLRELGEDAFRTHGENFSELSKPTVNTIWSILVKDPERVGKSRPPDTATSTNGIDTTMESKETVSGEGLPDLSTGDALTRNLITDENPISNDPSVKCNEAQTQVPDGRLTAVPENTGPYDDRNPPCDEEPVGGNSVSCVTSGVEHCCDPGKADAEASSEEGGIRSSEDPCAGNVTVSSSPPRDLSETPQNSAPLLYVSGVAETSSTPAEGFTHYPVPLEATAKPESSPEVEVPPYYGPIPFDSPFSVENLPKLEEFIPDEYLPRILKVHDPSSMTRGRYRNCDATCDKIFNYYRIYPPPRSDYPQNEQGSPIAEIHLHRSNISGSGSHSWVFRAPLTLPEPLKARSRNGQVVVAAKLGNGTTRDKKHLLQEGGVYNGMPQHLMEDWDGFNIVPPLALPEKHRVYDDEVLKDLYSTDFCSSPSPILLMEECGTCIVADDFTLDQRSECYSLILRLNNAGITQGSFYPRNVLIQPGPLTAPPGDRSLKTPSFRIVDFGRGKCGNAGDDVDVLDAEDTLQLDEHDWES
ncbi:hypothetical protein NM688_g4057 [Phlebia brevispora]|uniref:Uncharacterized protein n=1 Tax=Phlebia brevispora TaxID=194682 RepID=A0ACC1T459_9APHY|nr:hypothetical protein NM688_g4057 [Phlebia brevispora]